MQSRVTRRAALVGLLSWPAALRGRGVQVFESREQFARAVRSRQSFSPSEIVEAGANLYTQAPGPRIPDLPGWTGLPRAGFLVPEHFGALGDGKHDDGPALQAGLDAGAALHGWGRTYSVAGTVTLRDGAHLEDMTLRQLSPGPQTTTLRSEGASRITLRSVAVNRNGDGSSGGDTRDGAVNWSLNYAHGIFIRGGRGHVLDRLQVYGSDSGTGLRLEGLDGRSWVNTPVVSHMYCARQRIEDDVIQGIWLNRCQDLMLTCEVHDLGTQDAQGPRTSRATRGITISGCRNVTVQECQIARVGQAIDFTGSEGNLFCQAIGNRIDTPYSVGVKFANSAIACTARGNWVYRPGRNAIIVSGSSEEGIAYVTEDCLIEGNTGIDVGYGGNFPGRSQGIIVERQPLYRNHPRGTRLVNNRMIDTQAVPTMEYGAYCDAQPQPGDAPNTNCGLVSIGHIHGAETGFEPGC